MASNLLALASNLYNFIFEATKTIGEHPAPSGKQSGIAGVL